MTEDNKVETQIMESGVAGGEDDISYRINRNRVPRHIRRRGGDYDRGDSGVEAIADRWNRNLVDPLTDTEYAADLITGAVAADPTLQEAYRTHYVLYTDEDGMGDEPQGMAILFEPDESDTATLEFLITNPDNLGRGIRGIGSALLDAVNEDLELARGEGAGYNILTLHSLSPAVDFYSARGFQPVRRNNEEPNSDEEYSDDDVEQLDLMRYVHEPDSENYYQRLDRS